MLACSRELRTPGRIASEKTKHRNQSQQKPYTLQASEPMFLLPTRSNLRLMLRSALLLVSLATYAMSPDDVVWSLIKASPHDRWLEHLAFGFAAILLGTALCLKVQNSRAIKASSVQEKLADGLQFVGLGTLLPLPGFVLLVLGGVGLDFLATEQKRTVPEEPSRVPVNTWAGALSAHTGLCCAFVSMVIFCVVLIDRVADVLFATSALISLGASAGRALRSR